MKTGKETNGIVLWCIINNLSLGNIFYYAQMNLSVDKYPFILRLVLQICLFL